jgi:hypothetical protein
MVPLGSYGDRNLTTRWTHLLAACCLVMAIRPAAALDPRDADILRLHLGMGEAEMMARLAEQGAAMQDRGRLCADDHTPRCQTRIVAKTLDGTLTITLADPMPETATREPRVSSVLYRVSLRRASEATQIQESMIDRFGEPSSQSPLAWCGAPAPGHACPADRPRLSFEVGPGMSWLLALTAGAPAVSP